MCKLCDSYNFGLVGIQDYWNDDNYSIFGIGVGYRIEFDSEESFKFCPACGKKLTEENFKSKY